MANFLERRLGCRVPWYQFPRSHNLTDCDTQEQYDATKKWSKEFTQLDNVKAFNLTGCREPCDTTRFTWSPRSEIWASPGYAPNTLTLGFIVSKGQFSRSEQYLIYDANSFIADIGGFLGLLLGYSMLSIVQSLSKRLPDKEINDFITFW